MYGGKISDKVTTNGTVTYSIAYNDGDHESEVPADRIQPAKISTTTGTDTATATVRSNSSSSSSSRDSTADAQRPYQVGDRIEGHWEEPCLV